ncbi:DNA damage-binding protein 2 [Ornithorhynchus anatinus]|uniref:DNA damage-binding protein 2 n=1 Tax=Ornithorhynchus anatinus TaxID=9258 RepID=F6V0F8_ORNAN|nr:DNA damage-binding protein 2 [Ornithorhynchus anatinus]
MAPVKRPAASKPPEGKGPPDKRPPNKKNGRPSPQDPEPEAKRQCGTSPCRPAQTGSVRSSLGPASQRDQPCPIVQAIHRHILGRASQAPLWQHLQRSFECSLASYRLFRTSSPFDRRATCLEWHPTHPSTLTVGSKGGDIILWDYEVLDKTCFIKGIGAGGSITGMKFNPLNPNQLYTSSMAGTTSLQDFTGNTFQVFTKADTWDNWYCGVDVSTDGRVVVTGDTMGNVVLLSTDGDTIWNWKLHKKKVTHVALNPHCDWLLATASVDQTVKIWDVRQVKGKSGFLHNLPHARAVSAACFSPDGARLLTTDQHSEIRVYSASNWTCPQQVIRHPHRHFQHLTPIKATWHPRYDLIVAGRYPDPKFEGFTPFELRTIDVFDGSSGEMVCQLYDPNSSGIISLNAFNPMGDTLASTMGYNILIWSREEAVARKQERLLKVMTEQGLGGGYSVRWERPNRSDPAPGQPRRKQPSLEGKKTKTKRKD